jgi:hypothetical protein
VTEQGRAGNAEFRKPNLFRLTYRHVDRANPTDEWRRVKTIEDAKEIAKAARANKDHNYRRTTRQQAADVSTPEAA